MANGLYEAPKSNLGGLAELYMAGQAQISKIRGEVTKQRAEESANLTDMIEKISLTGLQDADKMYNEGAVKLREVISQAQQDNANGLISRQDATRIANNAISQADLLVNSTELIGNKYEELKKEVASGAKSQADLDKFENSYFRENNAVGGNSVVTLEYGPKGLELSRKYTYKDPSTNQMTVGVINTPLVDSINPSAQGINGYDGDDWADSVKKRINATAQSIPSGTGTSAGGYSYTTFVNNPLNDTMVVQGIELMINKYTDAELIGVLYDGMGARATYSPNYDGNTDAELDTMKYKTPAGESLFQEFDSAGNLVDINFNSSNDKDLFRIDHELDGTLKISDRQKQMARAFLRKKALLALGVDYTNRFGRKAKSTSTSATSNSNFSNFNYNNAPADTNETPYGTGNRNYTSNTLNMIENLSGYEQVANMIASGKPGSNLTSLVNYNNAALAAYEDQSPFVRPQGDAPENYNLKYKAFERKAGIDTADGKKSAKSRLFGVEDEDFTNLFISETGSNRQALNLTTINGNPFDAITDIGYIESDGKNRKYTIILHGSSASTVEKIQGQTDTSSTSVTNKKNIPTFGYATPAETRVIYNKLVSHYTQFGDQERAEKHLETGNKLVGDTVNDAYAYAITQLLKELVP